MKKRKTYLNFMKSILLKSISIAVLITNSSIAQETRASSGFGSSSVFINYSNSIFNTPIEEYKYVKTHRGIEIYQTYRNPTNGNLNQTIFPKSMPVAIIKTNSITKNVVIYRTYSNSIFNKPIESVTLKSKTQVQNLYTKKIKTTEGLPYYDGGKEIKYGGEPE